MTIKVSVITATLNSCHTVEQAITSVNSQTYSNIEHIFIDGGSTDNTIQIINNSRPRNEIIVTEPDDGIYDAMNKGVRRSSGQIIYFLNSDDRLHDSRVIEDIAAKFRKNENLSLLYGNVFYAYGEELEKRKFSNLTKSNIIHEHLCHQAVFAKRALFQKIGPFDTIYKINADYDWLLKVFYNKFEISYIDRDVAIFNAGGYHSENIEILRRERREIKRKYMGDISYWLNFQLYRAKRKLYSMIAIKSGLLKDQS